MSGIEALGALAAASQLVAYGAKVIIAISDLYSKVENAAELIQRQLVEVEQLIDIAKLVEENPSLQTKLVASVLQDCVDELEKLQDILRTLHSTVEDGRAKKLWKALDGLSKEKDILARFAKLEQRKTSLALCIKTIDRQALLSDGLGFLLTIFKLPAADYPP